MPSSKSNHHIECEFDAESGMIERLLRVIRVRGFDVNGMQLHCCNEIYKARFDLTGERAVDNLMAQIEKLVGVIDIEILNTGTCNETMLEICA